MNHKSSLICGAIICLLAVVFGAFGAHALKGILIENQRVDVYELANRYQFYHGLGLLLLGALFQKTHDAHKLQWARALMILGVIIFSGSLYTLALSNIAWLGAITPIGGSLMIVAWGIIVWHIVSTQ